MENYEIKKRADQTSDKNTFQVLDTKPLTNANNDASGLKQEDNDDAIPSMSLFQSCIISSYCVKKNQIKYFPSLIIKAFWKIKLLSN